MTSFGVKISVVSPPCGGVSPALCEAFRSQRDPVAMKISRKPFDKSVWADAETERWSLTLAILGQLRQTPPSDFGDQAVARKLRLIRNAAASLRSRLENLDLVAAPAQHAGTLEPRRPGPYDCDPRLLGSGRNSLGMPSPPELFAKGWILRARNPDAVEVAGDAYVTTNASAHVVSPAISKLGGSERIGDRLTSCSDQVDNRPL